MNNQLEDLRSKLKDVIQFILDNMEQEATQTIQAEFNILYGQYQEGLNNCTLSEETLIKKNFQAGIEVPVDKLDQFEEWFDDRIRSMMRTEGRITKELN